MNLFKRIQTLWKLSELTVTQNSPGSIDIDYKPELREKPKMAEIIKRTTPVDEFLANEETK